MTEVRVTVTTVDGVLLDTVTLELGAAERELLDQLGLTPGTSIEVGSNHGDAQ